jgi:hypothetical protein
LVARLLLALPVPQPEHAAGTEDDEYRCGRIDEVRAYNTPQKSAQILKPRGSPVDGQKSG